MHDRFGPLDILVNSAGTVQVGPLEALRGQDFRPRPWRPCTSRRCASPRPRCPI
ncbi:hypothetical protein ACFQ1I_04470 [Kitasatospora arboriphila]